ncbi:dienelactone hydrolase family protein [Rheinheimera gaetbuli]
MATHVLVLSDIFGLCAGLERLLADLNQAGAVVQVLDPYQGTRMQLADEAQAYTAYGAQCGHDAYAAIATQALQNNVQPIDLAIGFSAGATALWRALAKVDASVVKQAVLFYPGQIHNHIILSPKVPTQVIFGHSEPHFDVTDICTQLQQKSAVTSISTGFAHGFMNPVSKAFNAAGCQQYLAVLQAIVA